MATLLDFFPAIGFFSKPDMKQKLRVYLYFLGSLPVTGSISGLCEQLCALSVNKEEVEFGFAGCELEIRC